MTNFENTGSISTVRLHRMLATLKGHETPLTVDFRKGMDGLAALVKANPGADPFSGTVGRKSLT